MKEFKSRRIEKWEDRLVFSYLCLVGKIKKWRDRKLIYLVEKKNKRMEKEFGINLQFCVCANKKVTHFFSKKIVYVQVDEKEKKRKKK